MNPQSPLYFGKLRSLYFYTVVLGIFWTLTTVECLEYRRVSRKLSSSPDPDLDTQFSNEELRQLLSILDSNSKDKGTTTVSPMHHNAMILPELMRIRPSDSTTVSPVSRVTRRFYRRLRRKTTTAPPTAESPSTPSATARVDHGVNESGRMLTAGSDLLQQLSLLNGILGVLNSTSQTPTDTAPSLTPPTNNANDNATPVPDFLALFTGGKATGAASTKSEVVVPPPPPPPPPTSSPAAPQVADPSATLALLNLFSNSGSSSGSRDASENNQNAAANLLNLVAQSQQAAVQPAPPPSSSPSETDATAAALTKLLLQSSAPANAMHGNSIMQSQMQQSNNAEASANQLNGLLGLLGTLGGAGQQVQTGNINSLFNLGGDQVAQAQTSNSLSQLFGQQTQQQQSQAQNLLSLLGASQGGNQGFSLASLLGSQSGNSIPGLGLLSTVSNLGTSLFSTLSNIVGGSQDGKPRVRGKGVDTRVGLGYRLGNIGDAQVVWDIGPQLFTDPLRNEPRPYTQKRESGTAAGSHYFQPPSVTETEKEVQQIEAKRRMVQAAIQSHYRGDHFASVYPKPSQRISNNHYDSDYSSQYYSQPSSHTPSSAASSSSSSFFGSFPFADHLKGFWSGLTSSGVTAREDHKRKASSSNSHYYNFDDVRSDFSANLIKRSSPDYTEYESRAHHRRRLDEDLDDPTHSTLTEYERMLLQYGKDIGVANTKHGVINDEPQASESGLFPTWFKNPFSSSKPPATSRAPAAPPHSAEWGLRRDDEENNEYRSIKPNNQAQKSVKKPSPSASSFGNNGGSFNRRNNNKQRRNSQRPQKRRSHNPFRNWIASFKQSAQRPRHASPSIGFGRRHFKRPSVSANPQLQHFTNTNKDLMMADANNDFVESAAMESYNTAYDQPLSYKYSSEFPDVSLTMPAPPRRLRPTAGGSANSNNFRSKVRASLSQREKIVEPALLYDHLEVLDDAPQTEADESFHQRNKVVVKNSAVKATQKQKISGTSASTGKPPISSITKIHQLRLQNKLRANANGTTGKQKIIVKVKGKGTPSSHNHPKIPSLIGNHDGFSESTTALPSVLSTISSMFSGTTKPKVLNNLLHNVTSMFPSITSIRILPRKKKKDQTKTRLIFQNNKPAIVALPEAEEEDEDDDQETAADGDEAIPVVQVGHDMSFNELQSLFGTGKNNNTKKRRYRIRVKESVLRGDKDEKGNKERKDSDEDEQDADDDKDIFVDIESGEVSVLKPVASLVSFNPKKEEASDEEEVDYYEDDDGDSIPDHAMTRKEHIFDAIQKELVRNFEKMKKSQQKAEAKRRRKQELAEKGMDESIDVVTKYFDLMQNDNKGADKQGTSQSKFKPAGGLSM